MPSAIAAIVSVLATFYIGKRLSGTVAGFVSGIVLMTMPQFIGSARLAFPDMFLTCFVTLAFAFFIRGYFAEKKAISFLLFWFFAALGMMTKGPVTLVILLVPVMVYIAVLREWRLFRQMQPVKGIILFLVVSLPWYLFVIIRLHGLLGFLIGEQTVERLTSGYREMPRYFLTGVVGVLSFPWLFYFLAGAGMLVRSRPKTGSGESARYLVLAWFLVVIVFFSSLRSSIASYVLPAYPPMAVVTAMFMAEQFSTRGMSRAFVLSAVMTILVIAALAVVSICYYFRIPEYAGYAFLQRPILLSAVLLSAITLLAAGLVLMRRFRCLFGVQALLFPILLVVFLFEIPEVEKRFHWRVKGKHMAEKILELREDGDEVVMMKQYYADLPFYLRRRVLHLHVHRERRFEDAKTYDRLVLFGDAERKLLESETRTFFVAPEREYRRVNAEYPDNSYFIKEIKGHVLFSNQALDLTAGSDD